MKKIFSCLMVLAIVAGIFVGCGNKNESAFKEVDGVLVCVDTESSPFEGGGVKIEVKKGEEGYAKFIKTDAEGNDTVEYYNFDYNKNLMEKYKYVSAMGVGFYYYYDLEKGELTKVEDNDHKDSTESMKESGRWDKAASSTKEEVTMIEKYFSEKHGSTIKEFLNEK